MVDLCVTAITTDDSVEWYVLLCHSMMRCDSSTRIVCCVLNSRIGKLKGKVITVLIIFEGSWHHLGVSRILGKQLVHVLSKFILSVQSCSPTSRLDWCDECSLTRL